MRVVVVGTVRFDVVAALLRHDNGGVLENALPFGGRQDFMFARLDIADFAAREIAAVVDEADIVCREVLPRPVDRRELAVVRIFHTDIVARVVACVSEVSVRVQRMADMHGQVARLLRHPVRLVRRNHDLDIQKCPLRSSKSPSIISAGEGTFNPIQKTHRKTNVYLCEILENMRVNVLEQRLPSAR